MSQKSPIIMPFARPLYVMAKPVGAACNLACEYCYYLEKAALYDSAPRTLMSDEVLERFIAEYIRSQTTLEVYFTWHGGEPLMRPIAFYRRALELQKKYAAGRTVVNSIQTNGTLINEKWCEFFRKNNFLVGVSIDGPEEFHDEFRRNKAGRPSFKDVVRGIRLLNRYGVEWNAMAVVNDFNSDYPLDFYRFFRDELKCRYLQFTPVVERIIERENGLQLASGREQGGELTDFSITPEQWGNFLCEIFDEWVRNDVGEMFVQIFDSTLANWVGEQPGLCTLNSYCGHAAVMEYNGDVYSCDHFVFPEYKLGNICTDSLADMMYGEQQQRFGAIKHKGLHSRCRKCRYEFACHGECPRNRFVTADGEAGLNYLCEGYHRFFDHAAPYMEFMKRELAAGRAPANVMGWDGE